MPLSVRYRASPNIALVKYWGKRDVPLNLPLNSSLSVTLSCPDLFTETTVSVDAYYVADELVLDGSYWSSEIAPQSAMGRCLSFFRSRGVLPESLASSATSLASFRSWKVRIETSNSFPMSSGLASSASGWSCLVSCLWELYGLPPDDKEKSVQARLGSGSACRSLFGGFVRWKRGERPDGSDSIAEQVFPSSHWPSLTIHVVVLDTRAKAVSSRSGMIQTGQTSELMRTRLEVVESRLDALCDAIRERDFARLSSLVRRESNQFHALCLDTVPPLHYLSDESFLLIDLLEQINATYGVKVAYSFDAGPNPVVFSEDAAFPVDALLHHLQNPSESTNPLPDMDLSRLQNLHIHRVYCCSVGDGPQRMDAS